MAKTRRVFVLLMRFPDNGSKAIHMMTGFRYTHASIGLDEDMNTFYSFVSKGFIVEKITRYIKPDREPFPCRLYELKVSQKVYDTIKSIVEYFVEFKSIVRYSKLGLVLGLLHIPYKRTFHFYCSQFVADVLQYSKAASLKKDSTLYMPGDLRHLDGMALYFQGDLQTMIDHFGIPQTAV